MENKKEIIQYIGTVLQFVWGIFFLLFPLLFTPLTTDVFFLPKEALLGFVSLGSLILFAAQTLLEKKVKIRQTAFDLPIAVFLFVLLLSSLFAVNRFDSFIALVPFLFLGISYFVLVNIIRKESTAFFLISSLVIGGTLLAILRIFTFFKVYLLPVAITKTPTFSTIGDLSQTFGYLLVLIPVAAYFAYPMIKGRTNNTTIIFSVITIFLTAGAAVSLYQILTVQNLILLPFITGFQIAFATISQDTARVAQGFFFGSGIGTFLTDFTRFKPIAYNQFQNIWYVNFNQSSSFVLELLATTGILGILSYIFLIGKAFVTVKKTHKNPLFISLTILIVFSFIFPFLFIPLSLLFFIFALFSGWEGLKDPKKAVDLEFALVALRKTFFNGSDQVSRSANTSSIMPVSFFAVLTIIAGVLGFFSIKYIISDLVFAKSLVAANSNNGAVTYQKQVQAITTFPYRDSYYRIFSQTNIAIGNSLLTLNTQKGAKPSQDIQNQVLSLIQQAISVGKTATTIAPESVANWQNLASIYRSIIGVGQNADQFTISTMQQAIALDPNNPQEYVTLGGVYYQLNQWDNAIKQFQIAVTLKPDYPNAYYNIGHAFEQKGDLANALSAYQAVKTLVANDKANTERITLEIETIQAKIGSQAPAQTTQAQQKAQTLKPVPSVEPLNLAQPTQRTHSLIDGEGQPSQPTPTTLPTK